jgi:comEA protein
MNYAVGLGHRHLPPLCALVLFLPLGVCPPALASKKPPLRPVNINTATETELQKVPGIGPATSKNIVHMRKTYGQFKSVDDLLAIPGIGRKRLDKMRKYLTVGKPAAAPKNTPPSGAGDKKESPPAKPPGSKKDSS